MRTLLLLAFWLTSLPAAAASSPLSIDGRWLADDGREVELGDWRGRPLIVAMEYSNCRFICSITLQKLKEVQAEADRRGLALDFVIVSIDPEHDTPKSWQDYRRRRGLDRTNWHFLTGSRAATDRLGRLLGVSWWYYDEHLMHDFKIVRLAPSGEVAGVMQAFDASAASLLAESVAAPAHRP